MGINILIANLDKKQYLAFWKLGDNPSIKAYLEGDHAWAIAILTCEAQGLRIGPPAGSWSGDRVVAVMDCAPPNEFGIPTQTAEEPERNLYMMAWQEYQDYSYDAMAALCEHTNWYARVLAERVKYDEEHKADERSRTERLWHYGNIVFRLNCKELEYALDRELGRGWVHRYHESSQLHAQIEDDH